uniref:NB-ARC domain-containing protein n=1 Tax=Aegilops tauschii subsp. strangulata TaxID=200361 RepID=A0A453SMT8_AEGTS
MDFAKEVVVQAALSEILGRIFSSLLDGLRLPTDGGARDAHRRRLERLLGSIGSMVEEAEGRHINNHQLLGHLKVLTEGMYRARFALEAADLDDAHDADATDDDGDRRRPLALLSPFNRAKRSRITSLIWGAGAGAGAGDHDGGSMKRLAAASEELEELTRDCTREFVLLVQGYPRKVGKTTVVKHACDDERVRGHFARVEWFETPEVVKAGGQAGQTAWESDGPEYLAGVRRIIGEPREGRSLLVFDDAWPVDASAWRELASSTTTGAGDCKLIFTCRDADLARDMSTAAEPVVLGKAPMEEYWYYFKAFAFGGGADPRDNPRAAAVGRQICERLDRTYLDARVLGGLLGANLGDTPFWRRMLAALARCERRPLHVGVLLELLPVNGRRLQSYGYCRSPPNVTVQDVLGGRASGGSDEDGSMTVHLCRETLYMDHWYSITFKY